VQNGFRAVVSTSFADIFRGNSLKNGLLPIVVPADVHKELLESPGAVVKIDLASQTLTLPSGRAVTFPIDAFSRHCLLEGIDELGYILQQEPAIAAYEAQRPGSINTLG
jgi:3-isopropylmalate/(R)-2-methylmalate dehydratase small subunit